MAEATKVGEKPAVKAAVKEAEHLVDGKEDVCENPDCGKAYDPDKKKVVQKMPPFKRDAVRPSDMLCPQCEARLVEKKK